ncbi:MAG: hypothetical protein QM539_08550 [Alphaproteobacteria bacterium]|nr:hypothetical protein [Alphaproteobacteria bacterium]
MKKLCIAFAFLWSFTAFAQKATDDFSGKWKTEEGKTVEISKSGDVFIGKPEGKDFILLSDLGYKNEAWIGELHQPKTGRTITCTAFLENNTLRLELKKGKFQRTLTWTKL